ncbi:hypothetical protein V8G54_016060 [Vigna mungo]|uniref:Uncharacterized protein n=1 Tax=Vigna mungo TaxID=3915 RepID=A0AAQ3NM85_VIGMU
MKACVGQLHTDLRAPNLDNKTMKLLLGQIKSIKDDLSGIGCLVKPDEYVYAINEGLLPDYAVVFLLLKGTFRHLPSPKLRPFFLAMNFGPPTTSKRYKVEGNDEGWKVYEKEKKGKREVRPNGIDRVERSIQTVEGGEELESNGTRQGEASRTMEGRERSSRTVEGMERSGQRWKAMKSWSRTVGCRGKQSRTGAGDDRLMSDYRNWDNS